MSPVSDPILLFLTMDAVALILLGGFGGARRPGVSGLLAIMLSGLGVLGCLPALLMGAGLIGAGAVAPGLPVGPPGLSLHLALDPLSMFFLVVVFLAGTAIAAFQRTAGRPEKAGRPGVDAGVRTTAWCVGGTVLGLLAADAMTLAIGLSFACGAIGFGSEARYRQPALLVPLLLLAAVCLLAPAGFAPRFDAIRAAPVDPGRAMAAAALSVVAVGGLVWRGSAPRCWTRNALTAGVLIPLDCYLLLRVIADLGGAVAQTECGFVVLLVGGAVAVIEGWCAARHPDIDGSVGCLLRRQAGLAAVGIGLALVARAADLPGAASFALAASLLCVVGGAVAGVLASLAAHAMGASAGTWRLSRLGGLVQAMPASSAALSVGLLGLSALPPGIGFASLWLLFESILSAPRTGGLLSQLPLALSGAAVALSAGLAATASVRLLGTAVLGRPRTPQGAGAREGTSHARGILLLLGGLSLAVGVLPGPVIWLLGEPAIRALSGAAPDSRIGLALLLPSNAQPGYLALPVFALLVLATAIVWLAPRLSRKEAKTAGVWADGMEPPFGLPFGDPAAQSVGEGFVPALRGGNARRGFRAGAARRGFRAGAVVPALRGGGVVPALPGGGFVPALPALSRFGLGWPAAWAMPRRFSSVAGLWVVLGGFGVLLLVLAVIG